MPHARHGGSGVCALALWASKLAGIGLEKVQIGQTQVATLVTAGSTGAALSGLPDRWSGDAVPFLKGLGPRAGDRGCREARFVAFGITVTFGDALIKPA